MVRRTLISGGVIAAGLLLALGVGLLVGSGSLAQEDGGDETGPEQADFGYTFTYQGVLESGGSPVDAACDMAFRLYDASEKGDQAGPAITQTVPVTGGRFTVQLDFTGKAYDGNARWLDVQVRCPGDGTFTELGRQELTAAPHAIYAKHAPWDGLDGMPAGFLDNLDGVEYRNVVVVAKSGGDYASIQSALDHITQASAERHYLVWVAPGIYQETVTMKPYVHLRGSGIGATVISDTVSDTSFPLDVAVLELAANSSVANLSVINYGTGSHKVALLAGSGTTGTLVADVVARAEGGSRGYGVLATGSGIRLVLREVDATGVGSSYSYGLYSRAAADVVLYGGSYVGRGGSNNCYGIRNLDSSTTIVAEQAAASGENCGSYNYGLENYNYARVTLRGGSLTGRGGSYARGAYNAMDAVLDTAQVALSAEGGTVTSIGLYNRASGVASLADGTISARGGGEAYAVRNDDARLEASGVAGVAMDADTNEGLHNRAGASARMLGGSLTAGGGTYSLGVHNRGSGTDLEVEHVTVLAENASTQNIGLGNYDRAQALLRDSSFTGREGDEAYGIDIYTGDNAGVLSTVRAERVTALGDSGYWESAGLHNFGSGMAYLHGGRYEAIEGWDVWGIYVGGDPPGAYLRADGISVLGESGVHNYGVYGTQIVGIDITGSSLEGEDYSVGWAATGFITISHSRLTEPVTGTVSCLAVSRGGTFSASGCP